MHFLKFAISFLIFLIINQNVNGRRGFGFRRGGFVGTRSYGGGFGYRGGAYRRSGGFVGGGAGFVGGGAYYVGGGYSVPVAVPVAVPYPAAAYGYYDYYGY